MPLTVTDALAIGDVPPEPVQVIEYVEETVGATDCVPLVALVPVHPPDAVHDDAFVDDHVSVED